MVFVAQIACCYAVTPPPCVEYFLQCQSVEARHKSMQFVQLLGLSVGFVAQIACSYVVHAP